MPYKSAEDRRAYQKERYRKKKEVKQRELDTLDQLGKTIMFRKLTKDEEMVYKILTEKYDAEIHSQKKREQKQQFPADDQDISMYSEIPQSERIIKGEGVKLDTPPILTPIPHTENIPKTKPSSQSKEWWLNPSSGEYEPKPTEEDRGNVVDSPWKFKSIYDNNLRERVR